MRDRVCPIGDCTATVRFETAVVEVTPRYQLHDLDEVDEFAVCPSCDAEVAGFYDEDAEEGSVDLILDIDDGEVDERDDDEGASSDHDDEATNERDDEGNDDGAATDGGTATDGGAAIDGAGFDEPEAVIDDAGFDEPEAVIDDVETDDDSEDDRDDHDPIFGDSDS